MPLTQPRLIGPPLCTTYTCMLLQQLGNVCDSQCHLCLLIPEYVET